MKKKSGIKGTREMKKILHIAEAFGSGVFHYVKNLAAWQCKEYKVYVAYGIRPETPEHFQEQFNGKVAFIKVEGFTREIKPLHDLKAFFALKEIVKRIQPDLIHLHSTKAGIVGRWAIDCKQRQVLYSPHAYSFLMMDCSPWKRVLYKSIEKVSDKKRCITVADIEGEYEASKEVASRAVCIPNGINPAEMDSIIQQAEKFVRKRDKVTVCMLGKVVPQKNPELFYEIAMRFPEMDFVWIGAGPLEDKLAGPNIEVTGWLNRIEATARIMESDIFLFASAWESLSIALLEAMYIGMPCVVSRVDGNRDVIQSGRNGYVCDTKEEYVFAIRRLAEDRSLAEELGGNARQDILDKYNVYTMRQSYEKLYRELGIGEKG